MISDEEIKTIIRMEDWDFATAINKTQFKQIYERLVSAEDALKFYADKSNHIPQTLKKNAIAEIKFDVGSKARAHFERLKTND